MVFTVLTSTFELVSIVAGVKLFCAFWDDVLWGTLDDNTDNTFTSWEFISNSHSLTVRTEWNHSLELVVALTINECILNWDFLFN